MILHKAGLQYVLDSYCWNGASWNGADWDTLFFTVSICIDVYVTSMSDKKQKVTCMCIS